MKKKNMNLGIKLDALKEEDIKEVNAMLKALSSDKRINFTESKQLGDLWKKVKKGLDEI